MEIDYATTNGIKAMRSLRKGEASLGYYGHPLGELCLVDGDL